MIREHVERATLSNTPNEFNSAVAALPDPSEGSAEDAAEAGAMLVSGDEIPEPLVAWLSKIVVSRESLQDVVALFRAAEEDARVALLEAIASRGAATDFASSTTEELLAMSLADVNALVVIAGLEILATISPAILQEPVLGLMNHEDFLVRTYAIRTADMQGCAEDLLLRAKDDRDARVSLEAAMALVCRGSLPWRVLTTYLLVDDYRSRLVAIQAIAESAPLDDLGEARDLARGLLGEDAAVRQAAERALAVLEARAQQHDG